MRFPRRAETLDQHGLMAIEAVRTPVVLRAECAALIAAILATAAAMQEAIACVDLLSLRTDMALPRSDLTELAERLACADATFRIVAAATLTCP